MWSLIFSSTFQCKTLPPRRGQSLAGGRLEAVWPRQNPLRYRGPQDLPHECLDKPGHGQLPLRGQLLGPSAALPRQGGAYQAFSSLKATEMVWFLNKHHGFPGLLGWGFISIRFPFIWIKCSIDYPYAANFLAPLSPYHVVKMGLYLYVVFSIHYVLVV